MESEWRKNLTELGFVNAGFGRIARLLSSGSRWTHIGQLDPAPDARCWFRFIDFDGMTADEQLCYDSGGVLASENWSAREAVSLPFPAGYEVEPDNPV